MKHYLKTYIFKTLSILPDSLGSKIYHQLQNVSENKNIEAKLRSTENTLSAFGNIFANLKVDLQNKSAIEIGSGWLPISPYILLYKYKLKEIYSFDINKHYQKINIEKFNSLFSKTYKNDIAVSTNNSYSLPENVHYFPSQNIINANIPKVDIVFSRFVLEHVTPEDIFKMHEKFKQSLNKGSYIIHFISPSDHRAFSDQSLSLQEFLKYSSKEWDKIQTRFDYHNRLRLPQYLDIFKSLDLEIVYISHDNPGPNSPQEQKFRNLKLHQDFSKYSEKELTAGSINIVLKI
ncbi:class I SAM-dependent methyltransferase [Flavobacterium sp. JLP]|uniref:class I SAM-dependent methyltransferase n=1 Tax=unclassified Flavobacterium TaxID=196869 RepID=UPI00188AC419|nr:MULTISPECIES: class I SAM-dependent methyltransferase [unclassified Flavobacterium]MBF4492425.1 class I SAM-dependent methyltransferase [Flavobacterium sp. MR2016-29]MBF4506296.1 class I SAM-dependent methyltransferase [Flavobacterium sp. JLP]